jgi:small subunit ribosomal protein S20
MPNLKSSKKRMQISADAREKNRAERARIRTAIKGVRAATTAEAGEASLRRAVALLDRAATKHLIPANRVGHTKSALTKFVRALKA